MPGALRGAIMKERALLKRKQCSWFIGLIVLSAVSSFAADLSLLYENVGLSVPNSRVLAPDFQLEDLEGKMVSLKSFRGKIVLLNFWATWCKPCVDEMPDIERVHRRYKDDNLVVLAINFGENKEKVQGFVSRQKLSFTVLLDKTKEVSHRYRTFALPTTYLVDREGYLMAGTVGGLNWKSPDLPKLMEALLNKSGNMPGR
jgi:thiol-disulfide isomerase/thioredoxin